MVQLKSTDAQQITIKQKDIRMLEQHAMESHKAPVFAIQFLNTGEVWLMAKQEDLAAVATEMGPSPEALKGFALSPMLEPSYKIFQTKAHSEEIEPKTVVRSSTVGKEEFYRNEENGRKNKR